MNPKEVREAIDSLQQYLLEEYGMDTKTTSDRAIGSATLSEPTSDLGAKNLPAYLAQPGKATNPS